MKKNGLLEICATDTPLERIGGLDLLKTWLVRRKDAFGRKAVEYKLPCPKGLLIIGIPGTGKSLTAKATASVFQRPLLRLDAGRHGVEGTWSVDGNRMPLNLQRHGCTNDTCHKTWALEAVKVEPDRLVLDLPDEDEGSPRLVRLDFGRR